MGKYTTIQISQELRKELGKRCSKEQNFNDYIKTLLKKKARGI
jgi:predicted CopG family antitoxin